MEKSLPPRQRCCFNCSPQEYDASAGGKWLKYRFRSSCFLLLSSACLEALRINLVRFVQLLQRIPSNQVVDNMRPMNVTVISKASVSTSIVQILPFRRGLSGPFRYLEYLSAAVATGFQCQNWQKINPRSTSTHGRTHPCGFLPLYMIVPSPVSLGHQLPVHLGFICLRLYLNSSNATQISET